jgi:FixJ family two-component response regulator
MPPFISVVDDDRFHRASMRRLVTSLGYTVEDFASAADFLASPRLAETACLITDIHMPAMTGVELYRHLVDVGHPIPTILVTGRPNDGERAHALRDGVVCYLGKPISEEHLVRRLHSALQSDDPQNEDS